MPPTSSQTPSHPSSMPARNPSTPPPIPQTYQGPVPPRIGEQGAPPSQNKKPEELKKKGKHKIKNFEWGLLITAAAIVDIIEIILTFFAVGLVINTFIDVVMGIIVPVYFYLRGIKMTHKKVVNMIGTFVAELIPVVNAFPLWTIDIIRIMMLDKAEEKLEKLEEKVPGGQLAGAVAEKRMGARGTAGGGGVPPVIGASGQPMAEPGAVLPIPGQASEEETQKTPYEQELDNYRNWATQEKPNYYGVHKEVAEGHEKEAMKHRLRGNDELAERYEAEAKHFHTLDEQAKEKYGTPSKNVVDLRNNPKHERIEGSGDKYREAA